MAQEQFDFLKSSNSSGIFGIHNIAEENPVEAREPGQVEVAREEAREEFEPPSPFCLFFLFVIFFFFLSAFTLTLARRSNTFAHSSKKICSFDSSVADFLFAEKGPI